MGKLTKQITQPLPWNAASNGVPLPVEEAEGSAFEAKPEVRGHVSLIDFGMQNTYPPGN